LLPIQKIKEKVTLIMTGYELKHRKM
jgi:hypothetical protein